MLQAVNFTGYHLIRRTLYLFTTKKMLSRFRSRDEEQFPPRKNIAPVFKGMEIVVGIFPWSQQYFFRVRQPNISELNNEVDLRPVQDHLRQICGIKSSNGLIRVQQKIVLQSPKTKLWFSKSSDTSEFHRPSVISLFLVKPTSLDSSVSPFACGQSHSASPWLRAVLSSKRGSQRFMCALQMNPRKGEFHI